MEVTVVGAGVIGLTTALLLAEQNYKVKVVATHFPTDGLNAQYTSPWAGAHFRPFPSKNESEKRESYLTRATMEYFRGISERDPESSIRFVKGIEYLESPDELYSTVSFGYKEGMENFKVLPKSGLPTGVKFGAEYDTWILNAPLYLQYLYRKLQMVYGVEFKRASLNSLKQVFESFKSDFVVNCSGQGLQYSGGYDPQCFSIRGQTLLVRPPKNNPYETKTVTHQNADGLWTFVIYRPLDGGCILGGTKQPGDLDPYPRESDTKDLLKRGENLYPDLMVEKDGRLQFDVKNVNVGFRPARVGGSRVEIEHTESGDIIHAYGAGGMGYELSYGMAREVLKLLSSRSKL